jgi:hypothetical protein
VGEPEGNQTAMDVIVSQDKEAKRRVRRGERKAER